MASNTWQSINWKDPFLLEQQLSDDQMVRDTAHQFAQDKLLPRVRGFRTRKLILLFPRNGFAGLWFNYHGHDCLE